MNITTKVEKINSQKEIIIERKKYEVDNVKLHNQVLELKEEQLSVSNNIDDIKLVINNLKIKYNDLNSIKNRVREKNKRD